MTKKRDILSENIDAAFRESAADVIRRAKETGTPVVIWEDGRVKHVSPDEFIAEGPHAGERKMKEGDSEGGEQE